jgi:glucosylceramidase
MKLRKRDLAVSCLLLVFAAPLFAQTAYVRTTTNANPWVDSGAKAGTAWATTTNYIQIFPDTQYQTILGFGGTFQEKMYDALSHCTAAGRDSVIRQMFDTSGANISWGRIPIGLCDFDDNAAPYSLDDNSGDYTMTNFSMHRDSTKRIPLIKWAQAYQPNMRFFGSPWSPPGWMKTSGSYTQGNMKTDAATLTAYALYLEKAVQGFKAAGINIESITCNNEPNECGSNYPQCCWANSDELNFYKNYLIPKFTNDNISTRIILGVYCCGTQADWITYFMNDATVKPFVNLTSHSFQDWTWGASCVASYPTVPFIETESDYNGTSAAWSTGNKQFNDLAGFLTTGRASVFTEWDCVNDQTSTGGFGWTQDVMININSTTGAVTYNPYFYACKHFGHFVKPNAKAIKFTVNGITNLTSAAFLNPNGDLILVMNSAATAATPLTVKVGNEMYKATLPATSFTTIRIVSATAVQGMQLHGSAMPALSNVRIRNSALYFSLSAAVNAREADFTLTDLQGRTVWTGRRAGSALQGEDQAVAIRTGHGNLRSGAYLLAARIRNGAGAVMMVEKKLVVVN